MIQSFPPSGSSPAPSRAAWPITDGLTCCAVLINSGDVTSVKLPLTCSSAPNLWEYSRGGLRPLPIKKRITANLLAKIRASVRPPAVSAARR